MPENGWILLRTLSMDNITLITPEEGRTISPVMESGVDKKIFLTPHEGGTMVPPVDQPVGFLYIANGAINYRGKSGGVIEITFVDSLNQYLNFLIDRLPLNQENIEACKELIELLGQRSG